MSVEIKPGYKMTEVGVIPDDWNVIKIGNLGHVVRGGSPRPAGDPRYFNGDFIPWLTVSSLTNIPDYQMYVNATSSFLTEAGSKQSRLLKAGTFIISNSGATLGVAKILGIKCCANDGVAALIAQTNGDKRFLFHYINTLTRYLHDVVATGNGQPNLNTGLIENLLIPFPPEAEQASIASILSDTDELTGSLEQLILKKRQIKQGEMQTLLNPYDGSKLKNGWTTKRLGDLLDYEQPTQYLVEDSKYNDNNNIPVLTAGKTFILGYTHEEFGVFNNDLPVIIFDDFTTASKFVSFPFKAKSSAMKILKRKNEKVNLRLIYEIIQRINYPLGDHKRHWISEFQHLNVFIPENVTEQTRIANILSDMDSEIVALETKLAKMKQIKQAMIYNFFTGKIRLV